MKALNIKLDPKLNINEWRTDAFKLDLEIQADLTGEQKKEMLSEAHNCFVHRNLKHEPEITLNLRII